MAADATGQFIAWWKILPRATLENASLLSGIMLNKMAHHCRK